MPAKREFRDRPQTEVAVLDALAERPGDGMTVFELRTGVDVSIDDIEAALASLTAAGLVHAEEAEGRTKFRVDERVVARPADDATDESSVLDAIRRRIGL
ncbi:MULTISPECIES: DUF6432 family protein [Halobacterium]|uniref:DUF6432 family protein n=1 Tax=Halobacterium TaxID=2239 RepID=UPI0019663CD2|nr:MULTISPECIES: DUF6432 family protein [Halobacterium]MDL0126587.1 DUF6432 family protein [Halobacterium salinarum]QRY24747.1 DUF6432 family protein [Halobacterium sp. BOL4-2]